MAAIGRQESIVEIKWINFESLPWALAGLGDEDEDVAKQLGTTLKQRYQDTRHLQHHRVTIDFLDPDRSRKRELQQQFELFLTGVALAMLPVLDKEVALLMFMFIIESRVEGAHSVLKRIWAFRNACGA